MQELDRTPLAASHANAMIHIKHFHYVHFAAEKGLTGEKQRAHGRDFTTHKRGHDYRVCKIQPRVGDNCDITKKSKTAVRKL